jgi:hypothetical protein
MAAARTTVAINFILRLGVVLNYVADRLCLEPRTFALGDFEKKLGFYTPTYPLDRVEISP